MVFPVKVILKVLNICMMKNHVCSKSIYIFKGCGFFAQKDHLQWTFPYLSGHKARQISVGGSCFCFVECNTEAVFLIFPGKKQVNHSCKLHVLNTEIRLAKVVEGWTVKSYLFIAVISIINYSLACAINMTVCVIYTEFYFVNKPHNYSLLL